VNQTHRPTRDAFRALVAMSGIVVAGCASIGERGTHAGIPPPPLRLVSAGDLKLPSDCDVRDGVVYRTNFVVQGDGRVAHIRPDPAPACLRAALTEWLNGVSYAPPGEAIPTAIDWMSVSARRVSDVEFSRQ
jgi:hypothetical protein